MENSIIERADGKDLHRKCNAASLTFANKEFGINFYNTFWRVNIDLKIHVSNYSFP